MWSICQKVISLLSLEYIQCGPSMMSWSIHVLFCSGRFILFYCSKKGMDQLKQKMVWINQDVIESPHCICRGNLMFIYCDLYEKKFIFMLLTHVNTRNFTVCTHSILMLSSRIFLLYVMNSRLNLPC